MRPSERAARPLACAALLALAGLACSPNVLDVVDPRDPLLEGLVGWWRFDDGPGSAVARDSSGQGNDGALTDLDGASVSTWPPGRAGASLEVSGAGYADVPLTPSIASITDEVTVSAWVYYEGAIAVDYGTALSREIGSSLNQHYHLSIYSDDSPVFFLTTSMGMARLTVAVAVPRFTWTHLAGTYDGHVARLYLNGVSVGFMPASGPIAGDTTPVILGGNGNGTMGVTERFPGRLDEVMLYKRGLSAAEIVQLSNGQLFSSGNAGAGQ